jgi:fluoride exporter
MNSYLVVFLGAGLGGVLRHFMNVVIPRFLGTSFPYHTLSINILGSLAMGLVAGYWSMRGDSSQSWRLFLTTGILGGFTTFSAFSLEAALLYERGTIASMLIYVVGSVCVSIGALFLGLFVMRGS